MLFLEAQRFFKSEAISFVSNPMSASRIHAPPSAMARGASFAGTCLTQTPIFKIVSRGRTKMPR